MRPPRPQPRAFTLVEILTVVIILGIASAVIVPQMGTRDDLKVRAASRQLMADLIFAQNRAIATQATHYIQFNLTAQNYSLLSDIAAATIVTHPITQLGYTVTFAPGGGGGRLEAGLQSVTLDGRPLTVLAFDELGVPYAYDPTLPADQRLIPLADRGDIVLQTGTFALTVHVTAYTGEITVD